MVEQNLNHLDQEQEKLAEEKKKRKKKKMKVSGYSVRNLESLIKKKK